MRACFVIGAVVLCAPQRASALAQETHQNISRTTCRNVGLGASFCERVGIAAYDVDDYEWDDPIAHAQMSTDPSTPCSVVNQVLERERILGADIRSSLSELGDGNASDLADQLGRTLHTIQDNCAHHGMPNDQHAWWSLLDSCNGSSTSPDVQPEAETCGWNETWQVMSTFVAVARSLNVSVEALDRVDQAAAHWPDRKGVCDFLEDASSWDGIDRRWNNDAVVPWLRDQLRTAFQSGDVSIGDACAGGLGPLVSSPLTDVSTPPSWCMKLDLYCAGSSLVPPWETGKADQPEPAHEGAAGCSIGGSNHWLLAGLALVLSVRRRRMSTSVVSVSRSRA